MTPSKLRTALALAALAALAALLATAALGRDRDARIAHAAAAVSPSGDRLVLSMGAPERIVVLDVGTGAVSELSLPGGTLCRSRLFVVGDRILFVAPGRSGGRVMSVDLALRERPRWIATADVVAPSAVPGRVWLATRGPDPHGHWLVRELAVSSGATTLAPRRAPSLRILGAISDGLVLEGRRSVFVWDPRTGRRSRSTPGPYLLATRGSQVASCGGRCATLLVADGQRGQVVHAPRRTRFTPGGAAFSSDGTTLSVALTTPAGARVALVDMAAGVTTLVPGVRVGPYAALGWTPSLNELYVAGARGQVVAYVPGAAAVRPVGPRFRDPIMQLIVAE